MSELWINIVEILILACSVALFAYSAYYNILWLKNAEKRYFTWIKYYLIALALCWICVGLFLILRILFGARVETSDIELLFVRPMILLTSSGFAASAKARYLGYKNGG